MRSASRFKSTAARLSAAIAHAGYRILVTNDFSKARVTTKKLPGVNLNRAGTANMQLVLATAIAIPIAGGLLFLGFKICRFVFAALSGSLTMPFV